MIHASEEKEITLMRIAQHATRVGLIVTAVVAGLGYMTSTTAAITVNVFTDPHRPRETAKRAPALADTTQTRTTATVENEVLGANRAAWSQFGYCDEAAQGKITPAVDRCK